MNRKEWDKLPPWPDDTRIVVDAIILVPGEKEDRHESNFRNLRFAGYVAAGEKTTIYRLPNTADVLEIGNWDEPSRIRLDHTCGGNLQFFSAFKLEFTPGPSTARIRTVRN